VAVTVLMRECSIFGRDTDWRVALSRPVHGVGDASQSQRPCGKQITGPNLRGWDNLEVT